MDWLRELARRLRMLVHRDQFDADLEEEMRLHLELRQQEQFQSGMTADDARATARRRFGNVTSSRERSHMAWGWEWFENLAQDLRYGARMLRKSPGFTAVAVLTLALGIGANTAIFSLVQQILLRPLPYAQPDRLLHMRESESDGRPMGVSYPSFLDWQKQAKSFELLGGFRTMTANWTGIPEPQRVTLRQVSWELLGVLGVRPALGRFFASEDDRMGAPFHLVISHEFWTQSFGANPTVLGRSMTLNGQTYTIIGILPTNFELFQPIDLYTALSPSVTRDSGDLDRGNHNDLAAIGRLKPGATLESATAEMKTITGALEKQYPGTNSGVGAIVLPFREKLVGGVKSLLWSLLGAVSFLLLIACMNVANLLLSQALVRQRELAIRGALGASRGRLIRQLLVESLLLAICGGAVGVLIAWASLPVLEKLAEGAPRMGHIETSLPVLAFTFVLTGVAAIIFGLVPGLDLARSGFSEAFKQGGRAVAGGTFSLKARAGLLISEVALSLVLLVGAGLMIRTLYALSRVPAGFDARNLLTMQFSAGGRQFNDEQLSAFLSAVQEKAGAVPGVESAALTLSLPLDGSQWGSIFILGDKPVPERAKLPSAAFIPVTANYFHTMRTRLLHGRSFTDTDRLGAPHVCVINETMARQFWPNEDPIGKRVKQGWPEWKTPWREVVGVAEDVKLDGVDAATPLEVYLPMMQQPVGTQFLVVRTNLPQTAVLKPVQDTVHSLVPDMPLFQPRSMEKVYEESIATRKSSQVLLVAFASIALVLAAIGLYGVIAHGVRQRTKEIGIRMALGAQRADILKMVIGNGALLAAIGIGIGLLGSFAAALSLRRFLFSTSTNDPLTLAAVCALLAVVALAATLIPAVRATRIDPQVALRHE